MKLNLKLLEASFNEQGTYFIKLEFIDVPKTNETLKHRTNVCNLSSKPHFNSDFIVDVDSHKRAKIYLTACEIQKTGYGEPTVISLGSARVYLDPIINTLNREPVYSSIVHFHADPDMSDVGDGIEGKVIGSCALTFSVLKRGPFDYNYSDDNSSEKSSGYARILFKRSLGDVEEFSNPNQKTLQEIHHETPKSIEIKSETINIPVDDITTSFQLKEDLIIPAKQTNGIFIFQKSPSPGQLIIVQIHDIWDLPLINNATTNQSTPPSAFVSVKTLQETIERKRAKASTHVHEPSTVASFGETLKLEFSELSSPNQIHKIFISIADNITKRYIARFYVPISVMKFPSYRQISLVLRSVSPFPNIPSPHARISITNIDTTISSTFSLQKEYESKMIFLELYLKTAQIKVDFRVICVAMVIHDSNEYKSTLKQRHERFKSGLDSCLNPLEPHHVLDFENGGDLLDNEAMNHIVINGSIYNHSSKVDKGKYYQMTNAIGSTNGVFIWNQHLVLFDKMDLYTPESSLVLEFYREPIGNPKIQDSSFEFERPTSSRPIDEMIGYASVALGDFTILQSNQSGNIINLDNLQVVLFGKYDNSTIASCSIDVRVPDNWHLMVPKKQTDSIPIPNTKPDSDKRIIDLKKGDPLPDISFEELISIVKTERQQEFKNKIPEPSRMVFTFHDIEQRQKMIDGLMQELDARANAIRKIGSDLYSLREINSRLEETVKSLEKKVSDNDIKTAQLINTVDIEVLSLPELQRRYALLVQKLSIELKRSNEMGEMLQSAQVSKIERNEAEKKYLELVHAHKEQSAYIQKLQDSLKQNTRYKAAIKKQELVIQKLEVLLKDSMQDKLNEFFTNAKLDPGTFDGGVYRLLTEENANLKDRLMRLEESFTRPIYSDLKPVNLDPNESNEKQDMNLVLRAEKAESRVEALEQEISKIVKTFAQQVVELKVKLAEKESYQRSFGRSGTSR